MFIELLKESEIDDDTRAEILQDIMEQAELFIKMLTKDKNFINDYIESTDKISIDSAGDFLIDNLTEYLSSNTAKDYISKCKCWKNLMKNKDWEDIVYDLIDEIQYDLGYEIVKGYDNDLYKKAKKLK